MISHGITWYVNLIQYSTLSQLPGLYSLWAVVTGQASSALRWLAGEVLILWFCLDCFVSGPKIVSCWMIVSLLLQVSSQPSPRDNWFDWKCSAWQPVKRTTSKAGADWGRKVNYFIQWETLLTASDRSLELTQFELWPGGWCWCRGRWDNVVTGNNPPPSLILSS